MTRRQRSIARFRSFPYAYESTRKRTHLYRKAGHARCMLVLIGDTLTEAHVHSALHQPGCFDDDIRTYQDVHETSP